MRTTPMAEQYRRIKEKYRDCLLFFRLGDFYELFYEDARVAARDLEITLTSRETGKGKRVPMCGVPCHAADAYIARLVQKGHRVAICEQVEDASQARGIVQREVVRVVTPGTILDSRWLEDKKNNFLVAVAASRGNPGLAVVDLSTGEFMVGEFSWQRLAEEVQRLEPAECLLEPGLEADRHWPTVLQRVPGMVVTGFQPWAFEEEEAYRTLTGHFKTPSLRGYGCEGLTAAVKAGGALLAYLQQTQKSDLSHINRLSTLSPAGYMVLDAATRRHLELVRRAGDGQRQGSLLGVLDHTVTAMGGRLLRSWIERPLVEVEAIRERLDAVAELCSRALVRAELCRQLKLIYDLERILGRVACATANARDLAGLRQSLQVLPTVKSALEEVTSAGLAGIREELQTHAGLCELLERALEDDPPAGLKEGGIFRPGYNRELDELREARRSGKQWIAALEARERERTGIKSLKVGFNQVFGYYLEVTNPNRHLVPGDYLRKQTLANAERYITPELKEKEAMVLGAEEKAIALEYRLFQELRETVARESATLQQTARLLARLDVLASLAEAAQLYGYVKPVVHEGDHLRIREGRHPVLEQVMGPGSFVPNDAYLDCREHRLLLVTGPNMAGKSTYCRQVALITLMAQIGSFVPAAEAEIGLVDRIFTRIGAADDLTMGLSTFMVEMIEVANIIHHATGRSLIILDEVGRGTSTFDGLAIAWAVAEYIHSHPRLGARTLFATHYHELTRLEDLLEGVRNYSVAVREKGEEVVFLRRIVKGGADRSYGIQVARLAGLPEEVLRRARELLSELEGNHLLPRSGTGGRERMQKKEYSQVTFLAPPHPVVEELKALNVMNLTPLEALNLLYRLQEKARESS